ncbi:hypothetical protein GKC29_25095 [Micromonospora sp. WMMC415]|uniref:hypothetical protein n=1 Tax=Micromonospora sp. WMMC415 TaxID=2675222 RepID=UPI0012B4A328|nr:hypothetical protein [Micromonospora sp. WMMC415]QGN49779.1 hypothetical protein GKC29_25095 [Micromonospora sp. WMMC415]
MAKPRLAAEQVQREARIAGSGLDTLRLLVPSPKTPCLGDGSWEDLFAPGVAGSREAQSVNVI